MLSDRDKEFVDAVQTINASNRRTIFARLLPNVVGPLLVTETLAILDYIFTEADLSFISLGW